MEIQAFRDLSLQEGIVLMDSKILLDAFSDKQPPQHLDWRLYVQLVQIWLFFRANPGFSCLFMGRDNVSVPHNLAN
jgi:hypothetical protein